MCMMLLSFRTACISSVLFVVAGHVTLNITSNGNYVRASRCSKDTTELFQFCYYYKDSTSFPYDCPYKDLAPFDDYANILIFFVSIFSELWINARENKDYGYYEWLEVGDRYGTLFHSASKAVGPCVTLNGLSFNTQNCNIKNGAVCVYNPNRTIKTYCESYNEICGTTKYCHCQAEKKGFFCENACTETNHSECGVCENKFQEYPTPTITLHSVDEDYILVIVRNALKLSYWNNVNLIFCFTDVFVPSTSRIRYRYSNSEISVLDSYEDVVRYKLPIQTLGPGHYWCEGFQYPNLDSIKSNTIIAGLKDTYGLNFVLFLTIKLTSSHQLLPYNIHTSTMDTIEKYLDKSKILSTRPVEISKFPENGTSTQLDITFHISTIPTITNLEETYEELRKTLTSLNNVPEILTYELSNSEVCTSETTEINGIKVTWPTVKIGQLTTPTNLFLQENGLPITRLCLGSFKSGGYWSDVSGAIDPSHQYSQTTRDLHNLMMSNKTALKKNQGLRNILTSSNDYISYDIYLMGNILGTIATSNVEYNISLFTDNLSTITKIDRQILLESQIKMNATDTILYNFDIALSTLQTNLSKISMENIIAQVSNLKKQEVVGLAVYGKNGRIWSTSLNNSTTMETIKRKNLIFATYIPETLLKQILETNENTNLVTAVYLNSALFNDDSEKTSVSFIVSMFITNFRSVSLQETIPIFFYAKETKKQTSCGYWNYGVNELWTSIFGHWTIDPNAVFDENQKTCNFSHMTHFALLVGADEDIIIDYLSTIGCAISLLSIIGIFLTAIISKSWRESAGTKILLNFSAAIAIQMVLLLLFEFKSISEYIFCLVVGMGLHYIVISQFCWMLVISYLQYRKFVQVLVNEPQNVILKSCTFGWLTPLIPVAVVISLNIEIYNENDKCYPSGLYLYASVFLPVALVISINVSIFFLIFRSVLYKKTTAFGNEKNVAILKVKLGIILFFLMGFSWIFGLLGSFLDFKPFLYVFCITATVQGFVLYMYFVVCNKVTRHQWTKRLGLFANYKSESKDEVKTTSTTSNTTSQQKLKQ